jgi:hypothetical protein
MYGKTFKELQTEVGNYIGRPGTQYLTKIREWINDAVQDYMRQIATPWTRRRRRFLTNGEQSFGCPSDVDMPVWILDVTDKLPIDPGIQWDRAYPASMSGRDQGRPWEWQPDGIHPVIEQPGDGVYLTAETVATIEDNVYVQGEVQDTNSSGMPSEHYLTQATVYCTEASILTLATPFVTINGISRDANSNGPCIIRRADTNKAIAIIERGARVPEYTWVAFIRVPPAGTVLEMQYIPKAPRLIQNQDMIPPQVDASFVKWYACEVGCRDMGMQGKAQYAARKAEEAIIEERQKQLGFGDNIWQAMPYDDEWNLEGVD